MADSDSFVVSFNSDTSDEESDSSSQQGETLKSQDGDILNGLNQGSGGPDTPQQQLITGPHQTGSDLLNTLQEETQAAKLPSHQESETLVTHQEETFSFTLSSHQEYAESTEETAGKSTTVTGSHETQSLSSDTSDDIQVTSTITDQGQVINLGQNHGNDKGKADVESTQIPEEDPTKDITLVDNNNVYESKVIGGSKSGEGECNKSNANEGYGGELSDLDASSKMEYLSTESCGEESGLSGEGKVLGEEQRAVQSDVHSVLYRQPASSHSQKHSNMEESAQTQQGAHQQEVNHTTDFQPTLTPLPSDRNTPTHKYRDTGNLEFTLGAGEQSESSRRSGDVRVLCEDDGSRSFEKTTTYIAGDRESTDDLIKRILAEARGEVYSPPRRTSHEQQFDLTHSEDRRLEERTATQRTDDHRNMSVLDRKLASLDQCVETPPHAHHMQSESDDKASDCCYMQKENVDTGVHRGYIQEESANIPPRSRYVQETYDESVVRRSAGPSDPYTDLYDDDSQASSGLRGRHFRSQLMRKQQAILQHDDWNEEEASTFHREPQVEYIPDEEFIPQKADDTDRVVQEKTEAIRDVVDKQSSVLQQLKSASDSFEELSAEIKEIKQHFLDSQIRRSMILDDIEHEKMMMDQADYESGARPAYRSPRARYEQEEFETEAYQPTRHPRQKLVSLDKELEADTLGKGGLTGLAVGSSPLETFRHKLSEKYQTALSGSAFTSSYSADKSNKYQTLYDEEPAYNSSYVSDISGARQYQSLYDEEPRLSRRNKKTLTRTYGALDDSEDQEESLYKSPNLPSYRKYDYEKKDYSSEYSSEPRSLYSRGVGSSRYSSLPRAKTIDYSSASSASRSWQAPADSGFSSRFLDKVREKKACGEQVTRDKPFTSRFLGKSFDTGSSFQRSTKTKAEDTPKCNGSSETASTGE